MITKLVKITARIKGEVLAEALDAPGVEGPVGCQSHHPQGKDFHQEGVGVVEDLGKRVE
jgi:hypothetical protein